MAETWFNIICLFQMYEPKHLPFFSSFIPVPILYNVMILFHFMSRSDLRSHIRLAPQLRASCHTLFFSFHCGFSTMKYFS